MKNIFEVIYSNRKSQWKIFVFSSDDEVDSVFAIDFCSVQGSTSYLVPWPRHSFGRSVEPWPDCWSLYWSWNKNFLWPWRRRQIGHCVKKLVQDFRHVRDIWFFLTADDKVLSLDRDFNLFRVYFVQWKNCLPFWGSVLNLGKFWAVEKFEIFARWK